MSRTPPRAPGSRLETPRSSSHPWCLSADTVTHFPVERRRLLAIGGSAGAALLAACTNGEAPAGEAGSGAGPSDSGSDGASTGSAGEGSDGGGADDAGTSPSATPEPDPLEELADALSPREAAGQLIWVAIPEGQQPLTSEPVGGFFPLGRWSDRAAVDEAFQAAHAAASPVPPLIAVDQEGGQVQVLRTEDMPDIASAADLGDEGPESVGEAWRELGEGAAGHGVHLILGPVADVVDPDLGRGNAPVGQLERGFGTDPALVRACVAAAVSALDAASVGATLKHFPGLGRVTENTDHSATGITDDVTTSDDAFLDPFRSVADAVMLSSATYSQIDPDNPAMFSRVVVTDLLREQLGFDGVVMTDDVGAAAAVADVPVAERVMRLLDAGGDVAITADPSLATEMIDAAEAWGAERPTRLRESVLRVLRLKQHRGVPITSAED